MRGIGFVRGTNSALARVPAGETQELVGRALSFETGCLPLNYSGNPGVNGASYRGANWKCSHRAARLHDVVADPTESINLAASSPQLLAQMLAAYESYHEGAVPDLADVRGKQTFPIGTPSKLPVYP